MSRHVNGTLADDSDPLTGAVGTAPFDLTDASPGTIQYAGWRDSSSAEPAAPYTGRGAVIDVPQDRYFPGVSHDENGDRTTVMEGANGLAAA